MRLQFDFAGPDGGPRPVVFRDPVRVIVARTPAAVTSVLADADAALAAGHYVAGVVGYEAASGFDAALRTQPAGAFPLVWFGVFDRPADDAGLADVGADLQVRAPAWTPALAEDAHAAAVARIREAIADGETYQINYTFRSYATSKPAGQRY